MWNKDAEYIEFLRGKIDILKDSNETLAEINDDLNEENDDLVYENEMLEEENEMFGEAVHDMAALVVTLYESCKELLQDNLSPIRQYEILQLLNSIDVDFDVLEELE